MKLMARAMIQRIVLAAIVYTGTPATHAADALDELPEYQPLNRSLTGTIASVGSDTLAYVVARWGVELKKYYPGVKFVMTASGSSSAPPALLDGSATVAPMSRAMKKEEIAAFTAKYGYAPTEIDIALDAIAVYVNRNNPIPALTLAQLDAIYSDTHKCGYATNVATWGQLGMSGPWATREIQPYGRGPESGTREYFRNTALCGGNFKKRIKIQHGPMDLQDALGPDGNSIGYASIGLRQPNIRALPIAAGTNDAPISPTADTILAGKYPLRRYLYIYVNKPPGKALAPLEAEFIKLALSRTGQYHVQHSGFVPLDNDLAVVERRKIQPSN